MARAWDRLEGESDLAFLAFNEWMTGSPSIRGPLGLSEHILRRYGHTVSPNTIIQWRGVHGWKRRYSAWLNHVQAERLQLVSQEVAKRSARLAVKQFRGREIALEKTLNSLKRLEEGTAEIEDAVQSVIRKAIENIGNCVLDHDNQLRRLSASSGSEVAQHDPATEDVIPPIPPEPGCVQYPDPEAEAVLGASAGDMPGDRGPVDPDGDGDHGERGR